MVTWISNQIDFFVTPLGIIIFSIIYIIWVLFLLPSSWLSMFAGAIYGTFLASLLVFLSACFGAILTFWSGRTFLRNWAQDLLSKYPKLKYVEKKVSDEGLKLIFLTRLSPLFPFGLLNFTFGLSQVKFKDFSIGLIAILPGTILYCSLGSLAGDLTRFNLILANRSDLLSFVYSLIGFIATCFIFALVFRSTKKALQEFDALS